MEKRSPKIVMERSPKTTLEKLPPKSPVLYERYKSGCAWKLISFLDFRQGHSSKKPNSDRRHIAAYPSGNEYVSKLLKLRKELDKKNNNDGVDGKSLAIGSGKAESTKGMEEKALIDQKKKEKISNAEVLHAQSDSDLIRPRPKKHRKAGKSFPRPCYSNDVAIVKQRWPSDQKLVEKSSDKSTSTTVTQESCNQWHHQPGTDYSDKDNSSTNYDQLNEINLQVKMNEAAEAFINQQFVDRRIHCKDGANHQSKNFLDALEILNANKELFIKLLQDPSSLLVKHIQDLQNCQGKRQQNKSLSEAQLSECPMSDARECEDYICTKKLKSSDSYSAEGSRDTSQIVLLKPGPTIVKNAAENGGEFPSINVDQNLRRQSAKPAIFSIKHMKRKLRHVIGVSRKEHPCTSNNGKLLLSPYDFRASEDGGKGTGGEIVGRNSPNKGHIDVGRMANSSPEGKRVLMNDAKDFDSRLGHEAVSTCKTGQKISNLSIVSRLDQSEFNTHAESRKHVFEKLSNGNEEFSRKSVPRNGGRMTSLSEYYSLPPSVNSRRDKEHGSVTARIRYSPYANYPMVNENEQRLQKEVKNGSPNQQRHDVETSPSADMKKPNEQLQTYVTKPDVLEDLVPDTKVHASICSLGDESCHRDSVNTAEPNVPMHPEEINHSEVPFETDDTQNTLANESTDTAITFDENGYSKCSNLDSLVEIDASVPNEYARSSSPSSIQKDEDPDDLKVITEQPSPLSVPERLLTEKTVGPASILETDQDPGQLIQIKTEKNHSDGHLRFPLGLTIYLSPSFGEHGPSYEFAKEALQASGFDCDEFSMKCHSGVQLRPSDHSDVEILQNRTHSNPKLVYDYIYEVFLEVYQCYFRCSPWVSIIDPRIRPVAKDVVSEMRKHVDLDLISQPSSQTLEQLAAKDLAKAGRWLDDMRIDLEDIVIEMVEGVLGELIMETSTKELV